MNMNDQDQDRNRDEGGNDAAPLAAIESLDDYLRRYGLPNANGEDGQAGGEFNGLNRLEAIERVRAEEAYRDSVIERHHQEAQRGESLGQGGNEATSHEESEGAVVSVLLANESTHAMPVQPLIAYCDTAKRMILSRRRFGVQDSAVDDSAGKSGDDLELETTEGNANNDNATTSTGDSCINPIMELSLVEFDANAVLAFMDALVLLHDHQQKMETTTPTPSRKRPLNDETDENTTKYIMNMIDEGKISEQYIVECLKIAHYIQCRVILDVLASILEDSIDSHNCMAICSLADALNLKTLFEASVNFVINRLDAFQGTTSPENSVGGEIPKRASSLSSSSEDDGQPENAEEVWASLPYELRSRILTMRNVMRSSVIGRGSKVSGLFFSNAVEFLGIFREAIRDQKERLADAKERREEVIRERTEEWVVRLHRRGRWFDASAEAKENFINGADVKYALEKIEKQSRRLETLESFYEEQKTIFKGGGFDSELRL